MRKISRSIHINASPDRVFDYVDQPENLLVVWPSLIEVAGVQKKAGGGHGFDWVYKMAGMRFHGRADSIRVERPRLLETKNDAGIPSKFRWTFEAKNGGTQVGLDIEYTIPTPVVGKIAEAAVAKMNEHETEMLLANIKHTMEQEAQPRAEQKPNAPPVHR
jgi:uncharacterized protein YndB with AHSA1/START domain